MENSLYGKIPINPNIVVPFNPLPPGDLFLSTDDFKFIVTDGGIKILIE